MSHRFATANRTGRGERYGSAHQRARAAAAARHHPTDPCSRRNDPDIRCTRPLGPMGPWLHYDHDETGGYLGFSHASCNKKAAAIKGNRRQRQRARQQAGRAQSRRW